MRYFAVHDDEGNISRIIGCPPGAPLARPARLDPGLSISEVGLPEGAVDARDGGNVADLLDLATKFRVEFHTMRPVSLRPAERGQ
jgi:hypothetical protein